MEFRKDLTNKIFGRLTVLSYSHKDKSHTFWNCLCECGNQKTIKGNYLISGTKSCGCLKSAPETIAKTIISKIGKPTKKRKTNKKFIEEASKLHNNRYTYLKTNYVGAHTYIIITCQEHGDFEQTPRNHLFGRGGKGQGCRKCSYIENGNKARALYSNKDVDGYILENNIPIKRIDNYISADHHMKSECLKCHYIWNSSFSKIRNGYGCPKCNDTILNNEIIDNILLERHIQIKRIGEYKNIYTKIDWQCLKCSYIWLAKPGEIKRQGKNREGSGCPHCARQKNEKRISVFLDSVNIKYKAKIIDANNRKYFPDYYIPSLNLIIEYNGIQHYQPTCFGGKTTKEESKQIFIKQQIRDQEMREYCKQNNINLLEIDGRKYKAENLMKFLQEYFKETGAINER